MPSRLPHNDTPLLTRLPCATAVQKHLYYLWHFTPFPSSMLQQLQMLLLWRRQQQAGGRTQSLGHQSHFKLAVNEAAAGTCHCSTWWLYSSLKAAQVVAVCDACRHTCAEGWVWPVQISCDTADPGQASSCFDPCFSHIPPVASRMTTGALERSLWVLIFALRKIFVLRKVFSCCHSCLGVFISFWPSKPREDIQRGAWVPTMSVAHSATFQEFHSHSTMWNTYHIIIIPLWIMIPISGTHLIGVVWLISWVCVARSGLDPGERPWSVIRRIRVRIPWLYQALGLWILFAFCSSEEIKEQKENLEDYLVCLIY